MSITDVPARPDEETKPEEEPKLDFSSLFGQSTAPNGFDYHDLMTGPDSSFSELWSRLQRQYPHPTAKRLLLLLIIALIDRRYAEQQRRNAQKAEKKPSPCKPTRSELFLVANTGTVRMEAVTPPDVELPVGAGVTWYDVAQLDVCGLKGGTVMMDVCGTMDIALTDAENGAIAQPVQVMMQMRVIDDTGQTICAKDVEYVNLVPAGATGRVTFPFCFKCFHLLAGCEAPRTYRLQASLWQTPHRVTLRNVDWSTIVWEPKKEGGLGLSANSPPEPIP